MKGRARTLHLTNRSITLLGDCVQSKGEWYTTIRNNEFNILWGYATAMFCHYYLYAITSNECKPLLPFHKPLARVLQQHSAEREAGARLKPPWLLSPDARCDFLHAPGVHSLGRNPCPAVAWISGHGEVEAWRRSRRERVIITNIWHSDWAAASCVSALTPCLCMLTVMCDRAPLAVNHIHTHYHGYRWHMMFCFALFYINCRLARPK